MEEKPDCDPPNGFVVMKRVVEEDPPNGSGSALFGANDRRDHAVRTTKGGEELPKVYGGRWAEVVLPGLDLYCREKQSALIKMSVQVVHKMC